MFSKLTEGVRKTLKDITKFLYLLIGGVILLYIGYLINEAVFILVMGGITIVILAIAITKIICGVIDAF